MKRKLIDLSDTTFAALSSDASVSGTNLKRYIENLLDERAKCLEEEKAGHYSFSSSSEPSDSELAGIMAQAAESAARTGLERQPSRNNCCLTSGATNALT